MSNMLEIFQFETHEIRTVTLNDEAHFVVADLCAPLKLSNPTMAAKNIDEDDLSDAEVIDSMGRTQTAKVTNESGLYQLIFASRKAEAKKFRRWVTSEVLPALRKHGKYEVVAETPPLAAIAAQPEIERAAIARAQIEMLGAAVSTGLLDKLWATSKTHIIAARVLGEEPEMIEGLKPYYIPDYLKDMGLTGAEIKAEQSWFGKRVKAYAEDQGIAVSELRPRELPDGTIRETRAWRREHLPLFETVWNQYYAEKYARPMFLELGAA